MRAAHANDPSGSAVEGFCSQARRRIFRLFSCSDVRKGMAIPKNDSEMQSAHPSPEPSGSFPPLPVTPASPGGAAARADCAGPGSAIDPALVPRALDGDEVALSRLVDHLAPIVHLRVVRVLRRRRPGAAAGRIAQEAEDFTQDILVLLFSGPRVLADWQPERGLGLESFVDMVARRRTLSALETRRRDPWQEDPTTHDALDGPDIAPNPERRALSAQMLDRLLDRLRATLDPLGWHLFDLLILRELPVADVAERVQMRPDAVYARSSRLRKLARKLYTSLEDPTAEEAP